MAGLYDGIIMFNSCALSVYSPLPETVDQCRKLCDQKFPKNSYTFSMLGGDLRICLGNKTFDEQCHHLELIQIARQLNCSWKLHVEKSYVPID